MAAQGQQSEQFYAVPPISSPFGELPAMTGVRLGKTRKPFGVWLLTVITLGVYGMVWYYKINRELRDYNGRIEVSPGLALCFVTIVAIPTVGISGIVSFVKTGGRVNTAMSAAGAGRCSAAAGVLLNFLGGFGVCYYQSRLNRVWAAHGQA